jgi:hypothetical protein
MRAFGLFMILVNALFFIWAQLIDVKAGDLDRPVARSTQTPRIVLVKEVGGGGSAQDESAEPQVSAAVEPPRVEPLGGRRDQPAVASAQDLGCTTVGPFMDLANAAQAQAALQSAGFQPRQRMEEGELWVGYWVSVQNLPSRDAAEEAVSTLTERGITDVYIMPGSEPSIVLSLGVFSDYQRAQRRANEIRMLGFEPQIDDRKRTGSAYWIDVDLEEPGQKIDMAMFQTAPGKINRLELRGCPQSG